MGFFFFLAASRLAAAPLDVLLTALPEQMASKGYLELGSDHMNAQLDFFKLRDSHALASGTQAGDYHGAHLAGGWSVRDNLWLSGSLWQRRINGLSENFDFNSWQLAGQYRFLEMDGQQPALALRLSAWGNQSSEVGAHNICAAPVVGRPDVCQPNAFLDSVKISNPADKALQADLVASWAVSPAVDISLFLGMGRTELTFGDVSGSMTRDDKMNYNLSFVGGNIIGTTADGGSQFLDKASKYGIDLAKELAWRGNFVQLGFNAAWRTGLWTWRGGYLYYAIEREAIDDVLASRGWSSVKQSKTLMMEANYRINPRVSVYARGQLSTSLIFNDMPVLYNSYSADLFGGRYSIYTVGLRADY